MGIRYSVDENFFSKWSPVMAYVLGFIYADGSIYPSARGKYLAVTSVDIDIIQKIKRWLKSDHTIREAKSFWTNGKNIFSLRIGNAAIYDSLISHGVYPNKSLTIGFPKIPKLFLKDFVRGYFDGDGCVNLYRSPGKKQKLIVRKLSVIFTSGSKLFLSGLLDILRKNLTLKQTKIYNSHRSFQLRFATADSIVLFKYLYSNTSPEFFFARKFQIFKDYFSLRPSTIDKRIESILG